MLRFPKKKDEFQQLLSEQAAELYESALLLKQMVPGKAELFDLERQIKSRERRGDQLIRTLVGRLNEAFITPFDREDLHHLAELMDDVLDFIYSCASKLYLYKADQAISYFDDLAHILELQTRNIKEAFSDLRDTHNVLEKCHTIDDLENDGDHVYHTMIQQMFETEKDPIRLIKNKEIIEELEAATDACEDVADALESMVVKYA
ncbi:MAG: DUF47 family protein [Acidobacteria bacterium]|nr:DUF47 family protein [Acidobacteriota bacterium]